MLHKGRDLTQEVRTFFQKRKQLKDNLSGDRNKIYARIWHSEQRLLYHLFGHLLDPDQEEPSVPLSLWDRVIKDGWAPQAMFLHVYSRYDFCHVCCYTLENLVSKAYKENVAPDFVKDEQEPYFVVLGSYREEHGDGLTRRNSFKTPEPIFNWRFLLGDTTEGRPQKHTYALPHAKNSKLKSSKESQKLTRLPSFTDGKNLRIQDDYCICY